MKIFIKTILLLHMCLTLLSCSSMSQKPAELVCVITFEDGFDNDVLTFNINACSVIKKEVISSDASDGVTNIQVYLYKGKNNLQIKAYDDDKLICQIPITEDLVLEIILNGTQKEFKVDLSKGKFIGIKQSDLNVEMNQNKTQTLYD